MHTACARLRPPALFVPLLFAGTLSVAGAQTPPGTIAPAVCPENAVAEPITLADLWIEAGEREPGYLSTTEALRAESAVRGSIQREWFPTLALDGLGNYGQRLSPGEERSLGVGPRGELRLAGTWTLIDSGRRARSVEAAYRVQAAAIDAGEFDQRFRAGLASTYLHASLAEESAAVHARHIEELRTLEGLVRLRITEGIETRVAGEHLDQIISRAEFEAEATARERDALRLELSLMAGRCVSPGRLDPAPGFPEEAIVDGAGTPASRSLLRQADALDARGRAADGTGTWQLQLLGGTGPNYSRAFDGDRIRNEYLVGAGVRWQPDLFGVGRRLGTADRARAGSLRAEAASLDRALEREMQGAVHDLDRLRASGDAISRELDLAENAVRAAALRWNEGVGSWQELLQTSEDLLAVRIRRLDWTGETATALITFGILSNNLDQITTWLGQGEVR
jgi:outer membrane protein TolC